ncbi:MAG: hybrid sensor histidine kinase/response regulator [Ignavibacteriales bacterium]|nr:hybrid sensor histidine kinase/response regulator [Ignavibacteriales bacterium]
MTKLLIIDDEELLRNLLVASLAQEGYETFGAGDGLEGVDVARKELPDLIICDIKMPKLDGYGVLNELRKDPATAPIPFIFLTGHADRSTLRHGMDLGADDFLAKPVEMKQLLAAIQTRLQKREAILQQSKKKLDELRANISLSLPHEVKTPLSGIVGFAEILRDDAAKLDPKEISDMASHILKSATRLSHLIENFLIYAQIEMLAADPESAKLLGKEGTDQAAKYLEDIAHRKARGYARMNDVVLQLREGSARISGEYLIKIAEELIDNALKFSRAGTQVKIVGEQTQEGFLLSVSNQGAHMTAQQIADIGAYNQFDRASKEQKGSGLGLTIAKRLTELHGGKFSIRSESTEGTTVTVLLPSKA